MFSSPCRAGFFTPEGDITWHVAQRATPQRNARHSPSAGPSTSIIEAVATRCRVSFAQAVPGRYRAQAQPSVRDQGAAKMAARICGIDRQTHRLDEQMATARRALTLGQFKAFLGNIQADGMTQDAIDGLVERVTLDPALMEARVYC